MKKKELALTSTCRAACLALFCTSLYNLTKEIRSWTGKKPALPAQPHIHQDFPPACRALPGASWGRSVRLAYSLCSGPVLAKWDVATGVSAFSSGGMQDSVGKGAVTPVLCPVPGCVPASEPGLCHFGCLGKPALWAHLVAVGRGKSGSRLGEKRCALMPINIYNCLNNAPKVPKCFIHGRM